MLSVLLSSESTALISLRMRPTFSPFIRISKPSYSSSAKVSE
jgi:hypothetical protein